MNDGKKTTLDTYSLTVNNMVVDIEITRYELKPVPKYFIAVTNISPTTRIILEKSGLKWKKGPINKELCTPTGAAILYSLKLTEQKDFNISNHIHRGFARGSETLPIDPLKIYIY